MSRSNDNLIHFYDVPNEYSLAAVCKGHSSSVVDIDWSSDSSVLQSNSSAYEMLYCMTARILVM